MQHAFFILYHIYAIEGRACYWIPSSLSKKTKSVIPLEDESHFLQYIKTLIFY